MAELAGDRGVTLAMRTMQSPQVERTVNAAAHRKRRITPRSSGRKPQTARFPLAHLQRASAGLRRNC
jgi:hypothetical protein